MWPRRCCSRRRASGTRAAPGPQERRTDLGEPQGRSARKETPPAAGPGPPAAGAGRRLEHCRAVSDLRPPARGCGATRVAPWRAGSRAAEGARRVAAGGRAASSRVREARYRRRGEASRQGPHGGRCRGRGEARYRGRGEARRSRAAAPGRRRSRAGTPPGSPGPAAAGRILPGPALLPDWRPASGRPPGHRLLRQARWRRAASTNCPGVMPNAPLKRLVRWLWSAKPSAAATAAGAWPAASRRFASARRSCSR